MLINHFDTVQEARGKSIQKVFDKTDLRSFKYYKPEWNGRFTIMFYKGDREDQTTKQVMYFDQSAKTFIRRYKRNPYTVEEMRIMAA